MRRGGRFLLAGALVVGALAPSPARAQRAADMRSGAGSRGAGADSPVRHGFEVRRLARVDSVLEAAVQHGEIAGAVAHVKRDGAVVYERAAGWSDREAARAMRMQTLFRIASQTKAITSVAILMLMEEGKLQLSDPVSRWIPTFARTTVAQRTDTGTVIVPARRAISVRDLLTHTAGISYGTDAHVAAAYAAVGLGPAAGEGLGFYTADKDEAICTTMERLGTVPFVAQPGERWVYGYSTDVLGCIVERASGVPLDRFVAERITGPLGMRDTHFFIPQVDRERLAAVYRSDTSGKAVRGPIGAPGAGHYVDGPRRSFAGGAGLVSTAADYARFLRMIAHDGVLDGVRLLAPHTVRLMRTNQVGTRHSADGMGFGLGFQVTERYGANELASVGSYGWGGAYGSTYLVDPEEGLILLFMMQTMPSRTSVATRFRTAVYQALVETRTR